MHQKHYFWREFSYFAGAQVVASVCSRPPDDHWFSQVWPSGPRTRFGASEDCRRKKGEEQPVSTGLLCMEPWTKATSFKSSAGQVVEAAITSVAQLVD